MGGMTLINIRFATATIAALVVIFCSAQNMARSAPKERIIPLPKNKLCLAQPQTHFGDAAQKEKRRLVKELLIRVDFDQRCQLVLVNASPDERKAAWPQMEADLNAIYRSNVQWLKAHYAKGNLFNERLSGELASTAAWLIVQHADHDPAWQKAMLPDIQKVAEAGDFSKSHWAMLVDRVAVNSGELQIYGSQGKCEFDRKWHPKPIKDPNGVEARRKEVGLSTMTDNIARFVC